MESSGAERSRPLVLLFRVPEVVPPEHGILRFERADLGARDLFAVPFGRTADGISWEVIFN